MQHPNAPSCAVAWPRVRNNATDAEHATGNATAIAPNASKPASLQELRAQLLTQLTRNQSAGRETEIPAELRTSESAATTKIPKAEPASDNRVTCNRCSNLIGSKCAKWRELGAAQGWQPVQRPLRCEQFKPKAGDPDQRSGAQRWPALTIH
jgi:hypothetical protein